MFWEPENAHPARLNVVKDRTCVTGGLRSMQVWNNQVTVRQANSYSYGKLPPYHPNEKYPELAGLPREYDLSNTVYDGIRQLFLDSKYDVEACGTPRWNPLGWLIKPGMTIVLKPNLVRHYNDRGDNIEGLITQGAIIRAVIDYVYLALDGKGRIIVADAPQDDADFQAIEVYIGIKAIQQLYKETFGFPVEFFDLRQDESTKIDGVVVERRKLVGDPSGYRIVDLGKESAFSEVEAKWQPLYGAGYDTEELQTYHHLGVHKYCISQSVLDADVLINLPKLKTHKKGGVTLSMKNLVGVIGNKNCLPHHTVGLPCTGGDQFATNSVRNLLEHYLLRLYKRSFANRNVASKKIAVPLKNVGQRIFGATDRTIRSGNWYGNDTIWRAVLDLNRIVIFCDKTGKMAEKQQRGYLSIIDGVVGGEKNGPLASTNKRAGLLIFGQNPVDTDIVACHCIGFVPSKIPVIRKAIERNLLGRPQGEKILDECFLNGQCVTLDEINPRLGIQFEPHMGWTRVAAQGNDE